MTELTTDKINELLSIDDIFKAPDTLIKILFDKKKREQLFHNFLKYETDVSFDWFNHYFQDEAADRKNKKQDFTPLSVGKLLSQLVDTEYLDGITADICAGTGSLLISKWDNDRKKSNIFTYYPSDYLYQAEELSDRAIPFLLFNCMIRGMNAIVVHCDVLSRKAKGVFFIQNERDDFMGFSSLNVMPYTDQVAHEFGIEWTDFRYPEHVESIEWPAYLVTNQKEKEAKKLMDKIDKFKNVMNKETVKNG